MKFVLMLACVGHVLCGIADCFLSYTPKGRLNLKDINDPYKMRKMFEDMPLKYPMLFTLLGVLVLSMAAFGYLGLSNWMSQYANIYSACSYKATSKRKYCRCDNVFRHVFPDIIIMRI